MRRKQKRTCATQCWSPVLVHQSVRSEVDVHLKQVKGNRVDRQYVLFCRRMGVFHANMQLVRPMTGSQLQHVKEVGSIKHSLWRNNTYCVCNLFFCLYKEPGWRWRKKRHLMLNTDDWDLPELLLSVFVFQSVCLRHLSHLTGASSTEQVGATLVPCNQHASVQRICCLQVP